MFALQHSVRRRVALVAIAMLLAACGGSLTPVGIPMPKTGFENEMRQTPRQSESALALSLSGERLSGHQTGTITTCRYGGYDFAGNATGPFPGTFTATYCKTWGIFGQWYCGVGVTFSIKSALYAISGNGHKLLYNPPIHICNVGSTLPYSATFISRQTGANVATVSGTLSSGYLTITF